MSQSKAKEAAAPDIAADVAEAEFERFAEAMDLDFDPDGMDDDDSKGFRESKREFVRAMMRGKLTINGDGEPVYQPRKGDVITFHEPGGGDFMAMDKKKEGHKVAKGYATLAAMTKQTATRYINMPNRDLRVCTAIMALFLG